MQALLSIIGLGLLGIDPIAALIATSAIATHTKKYKILLFTLSFLIGTVVLGVILSLLGQGVLDYLQSFIPNDDSPLWLILNAIIIIAIIVWLVVRFSRRNKPKKEKKSKRKVGSVWQLVSLGLFFALTALSDPTFYAVIVVAAETHNVFAMAGLHLLWITITQIPLIAVLIAYYLNAHKKLLSITDRLWSAHKQKLMVVLYSGAIVIALVLLADTIFYLVSGKYLF